MLTEQYNQYNSQNSVADASQDSSFVADLGNFFAKQPGYEEDYLFPFLCFMARP